MIKKLLQAAILIAGGLALGGCPMQQQASTAAPASKPPAADYQAPVGPAPAAAQIRAICYNAADLAVFRARMVQIELNVAYLQCQGPGGSRAYESQYAAVLQKFSGELATNLRNLQQLGGRKRFNVDAVVTEFANRTAQRPPVDREFCARSKRAFDWALSPQVTSLAQVPPPYDLGPEMNVFPCPSP
ncbi:MAG: hypothetical protein FJX11_09870 [Alphaproteobacteria bacterium]|nr:hypothetical protein [Alphaproteobacteria bacterium]